MSGLTGTNVHEVLVFTWVLLFRKLVITVPIGSAIHRVLAIGGYFNSRVYSSKSEEVIRSKDLLCVGPTCGYNKIQFSQKYAYTEIGEYSIPV